MRLPNTKCRSLALLGLLAVGGVLVLSSSVSAAPSKASGPEAAAGGEPINICAVKGISGFMETFDVPPLRGAEFAAQDINKRGGILGRPLRVLKADYHTKVEDSGPAAKELLAKGCGLVLTACDFDFGSPAALAAQDENVLAFSDCAGSVQFGVQGIGPLAFTMGNSGRSEGAVMAEWAFKARGLKTAWTLRDTGLLYYNEVCTGFTDRFKELGGRILGVETFKADDPSVATQINKLRGIQPAPSFLVLCGFPTGGSAAIRQIRAAGFNQPLLSSNTYDGDYWKKAIPRQNLTNIYYANYGSLEGDDPNQLINSFVKRYQAKFGRKPDNSNLLTGYAVVQMFRIAAERAQSLDGDKLASTIESLGRASLLVGPTKFTKDLHIDLSRRQEIMQIQNGKTSFLRYWTLSRPPKVKF